MYKAASRIRLPKEYAKDKYRERYLNHEFSTKAISKYENDDLIQNDNEKAHSTSDKVIERNAEFKNIEGSKPKESFWHKLLKMFGF